MRLFHVLWKIRALKGHFANVDFYKSNIEPIQNFPASYKICVEASDELQDA